MSLTVDLVTGIGSHRKFGQLSKDLIDQGIFHPHVQIVWNPGQWKELVDKLIQIGIK